MSGHFTVCNIHLSAVQFYMMSLLAYYKVKFKAVMLSSETSTSC